MMYSQKIMEELLQNSTKREGKEGDVRVVKLKEGTTALATRTLNPEVDANSAIMVVTEVRGGCVWVLPLLVHCSGSIPHLE